MKRPILRLCLLVVLVLVTSVCASTAQSARGLMVGLYDDNQSLYGNTDRAFSLLGALRTQVLRANLYWGGRLGGVPPRTAAPKLTRPATAAGDVQPSTALLPVAGEPLPSAAEYRYAILQASEHGRIAALKQANPGLKVIAYKNMAATFSSATKDGVDVVQQPGGVGFAAADADHPDWFLADATGARVEFCDAPGQWQMDVGNGEYAAAWLAGVKEDLKAHGWDGVMIDDANYSPAQHLCGKSLAKYPTDANYARATEDFLAGVAPALRQAGLLVLPSISIPRSATALATWNKWLSFASGAVLEGWTKGGADAAGQLGDDDWAFQQDLLKATEEAGKPLVAVTAGPRTDTRSMRYARASFLLGTTGASALSFATASSDLSPEWAIDAGKPLGPATRAGTVWKREFSDGTVLVNPTGTAATVQLEGPYFAASGGSVSRVTLEPRSGIVLRFPEYVGGTNSIIARRKPRNPTDPNDPSYDWSVYDRAVLYAAQHRIKIVFSIWGTPGWANRNRGVRYAPTSFNDLLLFARAAATRYSGSFKRTSDGRVLPPVRHWLAWNEPNNPVFLLPQFSRVGRRWVVQSARDYARICSAVYGGVKLSLLRGQKVGCGVTAPRGGSGPRSARPSVAPLRFLDELKKAGLRSNSFDAYAHHPYYDKPSETPTTPPPNHRHVTLGNLDVLLARLKKHYGGKRLWITEYGYQTWTPDREFGVTWAKQAAYLKQAFAIARKKPRVDMMLWFLMRDDPNVRAGWQSGFFTARGKRKPAYQAFKTLPRR